MVSVGSSMRSNGSGSGLPILHSVEPMSMSSMPLMATMSPACAKGTTSRSSPRKRSTWFTFTVTGAFSSPCISSTDSPPRNVPRLMRPMPIRPT